MSPGMGGYSSIGGAVKKMWADEGIRGIYKGLYPNLLKVYLSPPFSTRLFPLIPCKLFTRLPRLLFPDPMSPDCGQLHSSKLCFKFLSALSHRFAIRAIRGLW